MKYFLIFCFCGQIPAAMAQTHSADSGNSASARLIHFIPSSFTNAFTLQAVPVLRIRSGDTVMTETIDASGVDKNGIRRQRGGNPLTGPFYVEEAEPGDLLAIRFIRISLNRGSAFTTESFVSRSLPDSILDKIRKSKRINWKLDRARLMGMPDTAYEHLSQFAVPLKPFLGCIGVAPMNGKNEIQSFFQGSFGGNLDFNGLAENTTLYLPVYHEGAYLYIGDGHAQQGDGELAGNALETSLDVEFSVHLIRNRGQGLMGPRLEDSARIMTMGFGRQLTEAIKMATAGMVDWLQEDYGLSLEELSQVLSTCIEYRVAEIADPQAEIIAMIRKDLLKRIGESKK